MNPIIRNELELPLRYAVYTVYSCTSYGVVFRENCEWRVSEKFASTCRKIVGSALDTSASFRRPSAYSNAGKPTTKT
jgi:hypothetical protein